MNKVTKVNFREASSKDEAWCLYKFRDKVSQDYSDTRKMPYFQIDLPENIKTLLKSGKTFEEMEPELSKFIDSIKPIKDEPKIKEIEEEWARIEPLFFEEMRKMTGGEQFFSNFQVYLIFSVCGHYEKGTNKVYVTFRSKEQIAAVCSEEILHLYYWRIFEKLFGTGKFTPEQWKISEVIPSYILSENPKFEQFGWKKDWKREACYHWIPELRKTLDPLWNTKRDFKDFMIKANIDVT